MADEIRLRVWLIGTVPVLVLVGVVVLLVAPPGKGKPTATPAPVSAGETAEPVPFAAAPPPRTVMPTPAPPPPTPPAVVPVAVATAAANASGEKAAPPEPIPELDELSPPRGSEQWTPDEKRAYREKVFDHIRGRERLLERELAGAQRSGDAKTAQEKMATLAYLRTRVAAVEKAIAAQPGQAPESGP